MNVLYEVFHKCDYINMTLESLNYYFQRADSIMSSKDKYKIIQKYPNYIETLNLIRNFHKIYQY